MSVNNHADSLQQFQEVITESLHDVGNQAQDWLLEDETRALNAAIDCDMAGVAWRLDSHRADKQGRHYLAADYAAQAYSRINRAIRNMAEQNAPAQLQAGAEALRQKLAAYRQQAALPAATSQSQTLAANTTETGFPDLQAVIVELAIDNPSQPVVQHVQDALNAIVAWQTLFRADAPTAAVRPAYRAACNAVDLAEETCAPTDVAAAKACRERIWQTTHAYYRGA